MVRAFAVLFAALCGALSGLVAGLLLACAAGLFARWTNRNDPSAGAVAIIGIFTGPAGMLAGAVFSGHLMYTDPRKFWYAVFPLSVVCAGVCFYYCPESPRRYKPSPLPLTPQPQEKTNEPPPRSDEPKEMRA